MVEIDLDEYDYDLTEERIAQYPVKERDNSKLLIYKEGKISHNVFKNIYNWLPADSLLVFNDTRVIRARILFKKETGAVVEVFCIEPLFPDEYELSFRSGSPVEWKCIVGNLKKWKNEKIVNHFFHNGKKYELSAEKLRSEGEAMRIKFSWSCSSASFGEVLEAAGHIPLPPYVKREDEDEDTVRYQTIYSRAKGSVAAPTAGLHFTNEVLDKLRRKGVKSAELTLHVGAGTFQPIKSKNVSKHEMHCEHFFVTRKLIEMLLDNPGNIISVGTTSVRTLESLYWLGVKALLSPSACQTDLTLGQWEPYSMNDEVPVWKSMEALLNLMEIQNSSTLDASTRIMIIPGYKYWMTDGMITNFHQPRSTLLLMVSAWIGGSWKDIYKYALKHDFRFLSYGDSSLLFR